MSLCSYQQSQRSFELQEESESESGSPTKKKFEQLILSLASLYVVDKGQQEIKKATDTFMQKLQEIKKNETEGFSSLKTSPIVSPKNIKQRKGSESFDFDNKAHNYILNFNNSGETTQGTSTKNTKHNSIDSFTENNRLKNINEITGDDEGEKK
jgi:hypothetical protein